MFIEPCKSGDRTFQNVHELVLHYNCTALDAIIDNIKNGIYDAEQLLRLQNVINDYINK